MEINLFQLHNKVIRLRIDLTISRLPVGKVISLPRQLEGFLVRTANFSKMTSIRRCPPTSVSGIMRERRNAMTIQHVALKKNY